MTRLCCASLLTVLLIGGSGLAQERAAQIGTKTCDGGYAAALDVAIPINDAEQAAGIMSKAFADLRAMAQAEGFTMLGTFRIMTKSMTPTPDQKMAFQVQMLFIEELTAEDLQAEFEFSIVKLEPQKVAYTYHQGALDQVGTTIMRLLTWIGGNNLQMAGPPWIVVHLSANGSEPQVAEIQVPVQ